MKKEGAEEEKASCWLTVPPLVKENETGREREWWKGEKHRERVSSSVDWGRRGEG